MRKIAIVLTTALMGAGACRDSSDSMTRDNEFAKPVDPEFAQQRQAYDARTRERLARVDARLRELGERTDARAKELAAELRVRRDELARRLETAHNQAKRSWN